MFKITNHKGFQITFENGWTVSVQFGAGNYCENYNMPWGAAAASEVWRSHDAEIAAWDADGNWYGFEHDPVDGRKAADEVLAFMNEIAAIRASVQG